MMKRVLSLILVLTMLVSLANFVSAADDITFTPGEPVPLPNLSKDTVSNDGFTVWSGNVSFDELSKGVTFVFCVTGVDKPINATKVDPTLVLENDSEWTWSKGAGDKWQWDHTWGNVFPPEMVIPKDGVYYLYLNQKVLVNNGQIAIKGVKALNLFSKQGSNVKDEPENENDGATFQMLNIVPNDLSVTVEFCDENDRSLTVQTYSYTDVGNTTAGDSTTGVEDGVNNKRAKRFGALITPDELYKQQDLVPIPDTVKIIDGSIYQRVWKDEAGNIVDGIYKSGKLKVDYEKADTSVVDVTFCDANGDTIYSKTVKKDALAYTGEAPTKASDSDYTYAFAGWSVDGENVIDLSNYKIEENVLEITFKPVFKSDLILKASLDGPKEIAMGDSGTYQIKFNRTNVTTDMIAGTTEPITSGKVVITYPAGTLSAPNQSVSRGNASVVVRVSSANEDGTIGEIELTAVEGFAGAVNLSLSGDANGKAAAATSYKVTVTGQQPGLYISEPTTVHIARTDDTAAPGKQTLWSGNVPFDGADAVSFVYKTDGVVNSINAYQLSLGFNNDETSHGLQKAWNSGDTWGDAPSPRYHTFDGNGYYVLYINKRLVDDTKFNNVNSLNIFSTSTTYSDNNDKDKPKNTNERATFTMLAVVGSALTPTVTFHDARGNVIGQPYMYSYVDENSFHCSAGVPDRGSEMKQTVKLLTPSEIFAIANADKSTVYIEPQKETDECYEYTFAGWADEHGNPVEAVYMNMDVYPVYDMTPVDPVNVQFINGTNTISNSVFPGAGHIEYAGTAPTKADDEHSYWFRGWTTDKNKTIAISAEQAREYVLNLEAKTVRNLLPLGNRLDLYAVFEQTDKMWDIRFYDEAGTQLNFLRVLAGQLINPDDGQTATAPQVPDKAATAECTYTPEGWADRSGKIIIDKSGKLLVDVTGDIDVFPVYAKKANQCTVTFCDDNKWAELGKWVGDYGTSAQAPKTPKKESTQYYNYKFKGWVDENGNQADLSNITADITVYASYEATYINPFVDVKDSDYISDAVEYAVVNNVMYGTGNNHFSPHNTATRAQMVAVLWRYEGRPSAEGLKNPFTDLGGESAYYYDAVLWAYDRGLVSGVTKTEFEPDTQITREQFVAILYRYAKEIKGYYMGYGKSSYDNYPDKDDVHKYASEAFRWAIATAADLQTASVDPSLRYNKKPYIVGVSRPDGKSYLAPEDKATRGQMVTMLYRFLNSEHVDAPAEKSDGIMAVDPSVYAVNDEYQICVLVERECTMWVEVGGKAYYDHSNGILRSDSFLHIAHVPQEALDAAGGYKVYLREIIERKPYYTVCGSIESAEYSFRPLIEKDEYHIINLADSHSQVDAAIASGSYFENDLDLLIMNGDIIDDSGSIESFKMIYKISGNITKGQVPCIYSRGNHELRGINAGQLADYTPTDNGKSYYTFRLGPVWGIVMDAGEDKADDNAEYGHTVACEAFRDEEGEFLDEVIASEEWKGASVRLVISHVPFVIKMSAPYNSEDARYAEWSRKLAAIEPTLWLAGHLHECFLEAPGDRSNSFGYPCPLVCSSYQNRENKQHTSGAIILTDGRITARYVTEKGEISNEESLKRWR